MTINDREWKFLAEQTGLSLPFNDLYFRYLRGLGYRGTLQDMIAASGLGFTPSKGGVTPSYDPDAEALFGRMTVQPDNTRKNLINTLVVDLKSAGVWSKLDFFYMMAAHNEQSAQLNWVANDSLNPVASPTFTVDRGYRGNGTTSHLEMPFNQALLPKAMQNNASWLLGVNIIGTPSRFIIGATTGIRFMLQAASNGTSMMYRNTQGATNDTVNVSSQIGRFSSSRVGSTEHRMFMNGSLIGTSATPSTVPASSAMYILRGGSSYSDAQVSYYAGGSSLTDTEQANADTILSNYLSALGI